MEELHRLIFQFNTRDLFEYYALFLKITRLYGGFLGGGGDATDGDAMRHIMDYYMRLDRLWFLASKRLRERHSLSDACVRRLFRAVPADWLLRFLQGDEELISVRTDTDWLRMRAPTREEWKAARLRPIFAYPVLHLGRDLQYQVTHADIDTSPWVEGAARQGRMGL